MGALQLSDARMDTDYQRHTAMALAYEVLQQVFAKFAQYTGRKYGFLHRWNAERARAVFVVAGAAYGTFEEVAREYQRKGIEVCTMHPNVLRPFPKTDWAEALRGKHVFVYDRDDAFGAVGGRLATELAGVVNEYDLAGSGTRLYPRIYGLGGRTPSLAMARDEIAKALREQAGELALSREKSYVGVNI
jgi:pyruvate ferredoxin oxidoreductase alpha subunit